MKRLCSSILMISTVILAVSCGGKYGRDFSSRVEQAVTRQMERYPLSTLQDIYMNFMQDRFGPAHLVFDEYAAYRHLQAELGSMNGSRIGLVEETGAEGNYVRVNLMLIRDGIIPFDRFFDTFTLSLEETPMPEPEAWRQEWAAILRVVEKMNLGLPGFEENKQTIAEMLDRGEFVMHHSAAYEKAYKPHYRILKRELFEQEFASIPGMPALSKR